MKRTVFVFIAVFLPLFLMCQYSFETVISSDKGEGLHYSFETSYGNYFSVGFSQSLNGSSQPVSPLIVEIDEIGELIQNLTLLKVDTSFSFYYGLEKPNGNFLFIGTLGEPAVFYDDRIIYVCEMTTDMVLVWEKMHSMPEEVTRAILIHFLTLPDNTILFEGKADTLQEYTNDFIFTGVLDLDGNLLDFHFYNDPYYAEYGVFSDFIFNFDTTAIYAIGNFARGPYSIPISIIEMDMNYNITNYSQYFDGEHLTAPTSVAWLPNGNLILADRENNYGSDTEGLLVKLVDPDFNFIRDTFMIRPGMVKVPVFNGLDYTDPDNIWIATFNAMGGFMPDEVFHVQVFDSEMNLKGVKEFGGEKKLYRFYNLLATSDGGCLITGQVPACDSCENNNGYLFKLMPEDVITTGVNEQPVVDPYSVEVYPNPFDECLTLNTKYPGLVISVHDFTGNKVFESKIPITSVNFSTGQLSNGMYFYKIVENGNVIKCGKLLKQ
jgi:hypothetical protein